MRRMIFLSALVAVSMTLGCAQATLTESDLQVVTRVRMPVHADTPARIGVVEWELMLSPDATLIKGMGGAGDAALGAVDIHRGANAGERPVLTVVSRVTTEVRLVVTTDGFVLDNTLAQDPLALPWLEEIQKANLDAFSLKAGGWDCAIQGGRVVRDCVPTAIGCATFETGFGAAVCAGGAWGCFETVNGVGDACGIERQDPNSTCIAAEMGVPCWSDQNGENPPPQQPQPPAEEPQCLNQDMGGNNADCWAGGAGQGNGGQAGEGGEGQNGGGGAAGNEGGGNEGGGNEGGGNEGGGNEGGGGDEWGGEGGAGGGGNEGGAGNEGGEWGGEGGAGNEGGEWGGEGGAGNEGGEWGGEGGGGDEWGGDEGGGNEGGDDWGGDEGGGNEGGGDDW